MNQPADEPSQTAAVRPSHPWTQADNAAGFVLRYVSPMRRYLIHRLGSESLSDHALTLFIGHLVQRGYGHLGQGRLRDFLTRGMRSAAKVAVARAEAPQTPHDDPDQREAGADQRKPFDRDAFDPESSVWLGHWRSGLLQLAWRRLEQVQHKTPGSLHYTVLEAASRNSHATATMLATQVSTSAGRAVDLEEVKRVLAESRRQFAAILSAEVASTLENPSVANTSEEMKHLKLK